jgi:diaminopimelate epimerase
LPKLQERDSCGPSQREICSTESLFYADDVVLFLRPEDDDIVVTMDILNLFGEASGLKTNL